MAKIERLKSGTYRIRCYLGKDSSGKHIYKSFTAKDKKQLQRIAAEYMDQHRDLQDPGKLKNAISAYITAKEPTLSPKTISAYESIRKTLEAKHPRFCALTLDRIGCKEMTELVNDLIARGVTPKTVRNYIGLISSTMKMNGYRPPIVTLPRNERRELPVPDEDTVRILVETADEEMQVPLALAILGLRRSEICALVPEDLKGNMLHIHSALVYDKNRQLVRKGTKTEGSERSIQIPETLARRIRKQGYVTHFTPGQLTHRFARLVEKAGVGHYRLHDMRHFFASYCHTVLKLSDAQIQKIGGWKTDHVMKRFYRQSLNDRQAGMLVANSIAKFAL